MQNKPSKKEIKDDLAKISALEAVKNSEGGKILIESCLADVVASVDTLCVGYTSLSHMELVAHCARLKERLDLYRVLVNAKRNKKMVLEALKEALEEDPDM